MRSTRAQLALIALAALALVVAVVSYLVLSGRAAERASAVRQEELKSIVSGFDNEQLLLERMLSESLSEAIGEMVSHGGYTEESLPTLNRKGIPFYFYKGNIVNIPTLELMNKMLAQEIERRLGTKLERRREEVKGRADRYTIGYPTLSTNISEEFVYAKMALPVSVARGGDTVRSVMEFDRVLPNKLGTFRRLTETYITEYERIRIVEESLISGMIQDDRVWEPPGRMMHSVSCEEPPSKGRKDLYPPIQENAEVAVSLEQVRVRLKYGRENLQWGLVFNPNEVELLIVANIGNLDWAGRDWSTDAYPDTVYLVPQKFPPMSAATDICFSSYTAAYDITFPILVSAMDLTPTGRLVTSESQDVVRTPEFSFYIQPFLGHHPDGRPNKFAVDASVTDFQFRDDACMGSCSIGLKLVGSREGKLWLDDCDYAFPRGQTSELDFIKEGVGCGLRTLVVEGNDPVKARVVDRVNIREGFRATYDLPDFASVSGTVYERRVVHCRSSGRFQESKQPLSLPGGMFVDLVPLEPRLGGAVTTPVEEDGTYLFEGASPGRYLVIARPLLRPDGRPSAALEPEALLRDVAEGANEGVDITLEPLNVVQVGGGWRRITTEEDC